MKFWLGNFLRDALLYVELFQNFSMKTEDILKNSWFSKNSFQIHIIFSGAPQGCWIRNCDQNMEFWKIEKIKKFRFDFTNWKKHFFKIGKQVIKNNGWKVTNFEYVFVINSTSNIIETTNDLIQHEKCWGRKLSGFREFFWYGRIRWIFFKLWRSFISTLNYIW